jgi:hypothetical protein
MKKIAFLLPIFVLFATFISCGNSIIADESVRTDDDYAYGGGQISCEHDLAYNESYHHIIGALIDFVGESKYYEWSGLARADSEKNATELCKYPDFTILNFIKYFDIKKQDFEKLYYETIYYSEVDYNVDLLYGADKMAIEDYYTNLCAGNIHEMEIRKEIKSLKDTLVETIFHDKNNKQYKKWIETLDKEGMVSWVKDNLNEEFLLCAGRMWNIPQFVNHFDVSKEDMEKCIRIRNQNTDHKFEYDIDLIYEMANKGDKGFKTNITKTDADLIDKSIVRILHSNYIRTGGT